MKHLCSLLNAYGVFDVAFFLVPQSETFSDTEDTTASQYQSREQESMDQNISSERRNFASKRPEQLTIDTNIGNFVPL